MENLGLKLTEMPNAHMHAAAALAQPAPWRGQAVPRMGQWRGAGFGLPIGAPLRARVPLISPMLFGGK